MNRRVVLGARIAFAIVFATCVITAARSAFRLQRLIDELRSAPTASPRLVADTIDEALGQLQLEGLTAVVGAAMWKALRTPARRSD